MSLTKIQEKDYKQCETMQMNGEDMECVECSCSAQQPTDYKSGLVKAKEIIEKEQEFAITVNPVMAMGMIRILELIEKEIENND